MFFAPSRWLLAVLWLNLATAAPADDGPIEAGRMYSGPVRPADSVCTVSAFVGHSDESVWPTALSIGGFRLEGLATKPGKRAVVWELLPGQKLGLLEARGVYVLQAGSWSGGWKGESSFNCEAGHHHEFFLVAELVPDTAYLSSKPSLNWKAEIRVKRSAGSPYRSEADRREALERGCRKWKKLLAERQWCPIP